jgi:hypothetical protein
MNEDTYSILTKDEADAVFASFDEDIEEFFSTKSRYLSSAEKIYLHNSLAVRDQYTYFYGMLKIRKTHVMTQPIVALSGSLLDGLGQWLDVQLQPLASSFATLRSV